MVKAFVRMLLEKRIEIFKAAAILIPPFSHQSIKSELCIRLNADFLPEAMALTTSRTMYLLSYSLPQSKRNSGVKHHFLKRLVRHEPNWTFIERLIVDTITDPPLYLKDELFKMLRVHGLHYRGREGQIERTALLLTAVVGAFRHQAFSELRGPGRESKAAASHS